MEKDKTPLLSGTLASCDNMKKGKWQSKDEQCVEVSMGPVKHNNPTRKSSARRYKKVAALVARDKCVATL